jgi:hypothetical protein
MRLTTGVLLKGGNCTIRQKVAVGGRGGSFFPFLQDRNLIRDQMPFTLDKNLGRRSPNFMLVNVQLLCQLSKR